MEPPGAVCHHTGSFLNSRVGCGGSEQVRLRRQSWCDEFVQRLSEQDLVLVEPCKRDRAIHQGVMRGRAERISQDTFTKPGGRDRHALKPARGQNLLEKHRRDRQMLGAALVDGFQHGARGRIGQAVETKLGDLVDLRFRQLITLQHLESIILQLHVQLGDRPPRAADRIEAAG